MAANSAADFAVEVAVEVDVDAPVDAPVVFGGPTKTSATVVVTSSLATRSLETSLRRTSEAFPGRGRVDVAEGGRRTTPKAPLTGEACQLVDGLVVMVFTR